GRPLDVRMPSVRSNVAFAAGYLVYRDGEVLVAQHFDERGPKLVGQPTVLADSVLYNPANDRTTFSVAANVLAYRADVKRQLTWRDRTGRAIGSVGVVGRDWNPAIAPDGSERFAVDRFEPAINSFAIQVIDSDARAHPLARGGSRDRFAAWSPDAQWIAHWS